MTLQSAESHTLPQRPPDAWGRVALSATSWDLNLLPSDHAELTLARLRNADHYWLTEGPSGGLTGAWLSHLSWDSTYFGVPMAVLGLEGSPCEEAFGELLERALSEAERLGFRHLRTSQRAGSHHAVRALQRRGFRVSWVSNQITCDTRRLSKEPPGCPDGLEFHPAEGVDFEEMAAALESVSPYNWPQFARELPPEACRAYPTERLRNCVETNYADHTLVALWRGKVAGFHASKVMHHDALKRPLDPFAYVRDTFVTPSAPPNLGKHLIRHALHQHIGLARQVTGRVRVDGRAMLNTALLCGYRVTGDELFMVTQPGSPGLP